MTQEDDPHNKALHARDQDEKPAHMTAKEWERQQMQRRINDRNRRHEPGLSVLADRETQKKCRECATLEIDWQWDEVLHVQLCNACKEKFPGQILAAHEDGS